VLNAADTEPRCSPATLLPDLVGPGVRLLFVGVNPGLRSAALGAPFTGHGNRFYPALFQAGILDRMIDVARGLAPQDRRRLITLGVGITSLVARPTRRADEVHPGELAAGVERLTATVARLQPAVVAILGITAYRIAFARPRARPGPQPEAFDGRPLWVVPNPSGRNAHASVATLAAAYREVAAAAGVSLHPAPHVRDAGLR
jgi:double-stranded uracil-DNA glycosylase